MEIAIRTEIEGRIDSLKERRDNYRELRQYSDSDFGGVLIEIKDQIKFLEKILKADPDKPY